MGRLREAGNAIKLAARFYPLIATELFKTRHRKPKGTDDRHIRLGSPQQAYLYWQEQGKYWEETPGAIEFLRSHVPEPRAV